VLLGKHVSAYNHNPGRYCHFGYFGHFGHFGLD